MAGPSIGTWVKVKNKSGRTTARVIANKFGGGAYSQGEVISQSEYNDYKAKRAEAKNNEARAVTAEVVTDPPRKRSRFNQLIDDLERSAQEDKALFNQTMQTTAKVAALYTKTLADAGVTAKGDRQTIREPQSETPKALPGKRKGGRLNRLADELADIDRRDIKNFAGVLGSNASMVQTIRDLESRRGQGTKKLTTKKKQKKLKGT